jgi:hypothetical protein
VSLGSHGMLWRRGLEEPKLLRSRAQGFCNCDVMRPMTIKAAVAMLFVSREGTLILTQIEVRDDNGPLLQAKLVFATDRKK